MSYFFAWFQGDDVKELEKEKQKLLAKIEKYQAEVKAIDEKVKEIESKK